MSSIPIRFSSIQPPTRLMRQKISSLLSFDRFTVMHKNKAPEIECDVICMCTNAKEGDREMDWDRERGKERQIWQLLEWKMTNSSIRNLLFFFFLTIAVYTHFNLNAAPLHTCSTHKCLVSNSNEVDEDHIWLCLCSSFRTVQIKTKINNTRVFIPLSYLIWMRQKSNYRLEWFWISADPIWRIYFLYQIHFRIRRHYKSHKCLHIKIYSLIAMSQAVRLNVCVDVSTSFEFR